MAENRGLSLVNEWGRLRNDPRDLPGAIDRCGDKLAAALQSSQEEVGRLTWELEQARAALLASEQLREAQIDEALGHLERGDKEQFLKGVNAARDHIAQFMKKLSEAGCSRLEWFDIQRMDLRNLLDALRVARVPAEREGR